MSAVNQARFTINGTPSSDPTTGDRIYNAVVSETLEIALEQNPSSVLSARFDVFNPSDPSSPLASKNAPLLTWVENSAASILIGPPPNGVNSAVHVVLPGSGIPAYLIRCTVSTAGDGSSNSQSQVFERVVAISSTATTPAIRKNVPFESTQGDADGLASMLNDYADAIEASGGGGGQLPWGTLLSTAPFTSAVIGVINPYDGSVPSTIYLFPDAPANGDRVAFKEVMGGSESVGFDVIDVGTGYNVDGPAAYNTGSYYVRAPYAYQEFVYRAADGAWRRVASDPGLQRAYNMAPQFLLNTDPSDVLVIYRPDGVTPALVASGIPGYEATIIAGGMPTDSTGGASMVTVPGNDASPGVPAVGSGILAVITGPGGDGSTDLGMGNGASAGDNAWGTGNGGDGANPGDGSGQGGNGGNRIGQTGGGGIGLGGQQAGHGGHIVQGTGKGGDQDGGTVGGGGNGGDDVMILGDGGEGDFSSMGGGSAGGAGGGRAYTTGNGGFGYGGGGQGGSDVVTLGKGGDASDPDCDAGNGGHHIYQAGNGGDATQGYGGDGGSFSDQAGAGGSAASPGKAAGDGGSVGQLGGKGGAATGGATPGTSGVSQWSAGAGGDTDTGIAGAGGPTVLGANATGGASTDPAGTGGAGGAVVVLGSTGGAGDTGGNGGEAGVLGGTGGNGVTTNGNGGAGTLDGGAPGTGGGAPGIGGAVLIGLVNAPYILSGHNTPHRHLGGFIEAYDAPAGAGTVTRAADLKRASNWIMDCFGADTITFTKATGSGANFPEGQHGLIKVKQNPAGTATLAWAFNGGGVKWPGGVPATLTLGVGAEDVFEFFVGEGSINLYVWRVGAAFA